MRSNESINKREVDGGQVHLKDQNGLIIGIEWRQLNVHKLDGSELKEINQIKILNQHLSVFDEIKIIIKSEK